MACLGSASPGFEPCVAHLLPLLLAHETRWASIGTIGEPAALRPTLVVVELHALQRFLGLHLLAVERAEQARRHQPRAPFTAPAVQVQPLALGDTRRQVRDERIEALQRLGNGEVGDAKVEEARVAASRLAVRQECGRLIVKCTVGFWPLTPPSGQDASCGGSSDCRHTNVLMPALRIAASRSRTTPALVGRDGQEPG